MITIGDSIRRSARSPGAAGLVLTALACAVALPVHATTFNWDGLSGRYDANLTAGVIVNTEKPNSAYIFQGNADSVGYGSAGQFNQKGARNLDDGRLNFHDRGIVSSPITLLLEGEVDWKNYGIFMRGKGWYDFTLSNKKVDFGHSSNGYTQNGRLDDSNFDNLAKFSGVYLLDAYAFANFNLGDHPLQVRAGNQVVNWGEGLFFQNGINSINPLDVAALRKPGAQLKEGLLPVPMLYGNFGLTQNLSLEAFYQLSWRKTVIEPCGTFFSNNDYIAPGCFGVPRIGANDPATYAAGDYIQRAPDNPGSNNGQYGFAMRYFADSIGSEFGAYYENINSRTPYVSVLTSSYSCAGKPGVPCAYFRSTSDPTYVAGDNVQYFADFPNSIHIYGLSFSTTILGASVFGEYSYRPNQPVQLGTSDLIAAFAGNPAGITATYGVTPTLANAAESAAPGSVYRGYDRLKISQLSAGFIKTVPQVLGADNLAVVGEVGFKYIHNLPGLDDRRYAKTDIYGTDLSQGSALGCKLGTAGNNPDYVQYGCSSDGFASRFSWGYRLRAQLDYSDLFAGINVSPFAAFGQDVQGWSYDGNFSQGRFLGSVGVKAQYLSRYTASLSWSGSTGTAFVPTDKDFIALSVGVGF